MRDLFLVLFVIGMLPVVIFRPYIGLLLWTWIAYMNPHRLTWSFAYDFRFNLLIALTTIIGILHTMRFRFNIPWKSPVLLMFFFTFWTMVTTHFSFRPLAAAELLDRNIKIQLMIFATLILVKSRRQIIALIATIAFSIGFFGIKGGIFTIMTGGHHRVMGPAQSFFGDNNAFALAMLLIIPLFYFVLMYLKNSFAKLGMLAIIVLVVASVLGSYSRGGFVGLAALGIAFWFKARHKILILVISFFMGSNVFYFMPEKWHERMGQVVTTTMESLSRQESDDPFGIKPLKKVHPSHFESPLQHETFFLSFLNKKNDSELLQDKSVTGRLDAWRLAILIANDRPFIGGGLGAFEQSTFDRYTPGVMRHAAHSIIFEVIGDQGYFGLAVWLLMHLATITACLWMSRRTKSFPELTWVRNLSNMILVGLIGYYMAGLFLSMAYFDLPFHLIAIVAILRAYTEQQIATLQARSNPNQPKWPRPAV